MSVRRLQRLFIRKRSSVEVSEYRGVRTLHLGGEAIQSAIRLSAPETLELAYTRAMMAFMLFGPVRELLMIGLGGGSIARFVYARLPRARMTVVEIHHQVVAAARSFFGMPMEDDRLRVVIADGAEYVRTQRAACDVLLLDAFNDGASVVTLATEEFYEACRDALRPGGILVVNFIADERRIGTYLARIEQVFEGRVLRLPSEDRINLIVLAFKRRVVRLQVQPLKRVAADLKRRHGLPFDRFVRDLIKTNSGTDGYLTLNRS
jgi:spermidine synthase